MQTVEGQEATALCNTPEKCDPENDDFVMISTSVALMRPKSQAEELHRHGYDQGGHNPDNDLGRRDSSAASAATAVADGGYASLKLLDRCRRLKKPITFITRLRLDAVLYEPAPSRRPSQTGRPRLKGERLANLCVVAEDPSIDWV